MYIIDVQPERGISSAGRAPALHAGGQEFESPILHHLKKRLLISLFFNAKNQAVSEFELKFIIREFIEY